MGWVVGCASVRVLPLIHSGLSTPVAILDADDRIIAVLAGRPSANDWDQVHTHMSSLLEQAGAKAVPTRCERRGKFTSLSVGVSYGGGQSVGGYPSFSPSALISSI